MAIEETGASVALAQMVSALEQMPLAELGSLWLSHWGLPPKLRSGRLLRLMIAWRLQAAAEGGLDPEVLRKARSRHMPRRPLPPPGTRLTREYRGVPYTVEIMESGVIYRARAYASLSEVACEITGTRWNGPRFFGLRPGQPS
jgi:hypothetical protein